MGFSVKELTYNNKPILYSTRQEYAGPWISFTINEDHFKPIHVVLKNIEPTPIYKLINSRKGKTIDRITLDFNLYEYLKRNTKENKINSTIPIIEKDQFIRLYIDIFYEPNLPYINTYFTFKNYSKYNFYDFNIYFVFDFDINGLDGYDNDLSDYDNSSDIIFQYDPTGLHAGFSLISKSTHYETCLTHEFTINETKKKLSNSLINTPGEILSALQIEFRTLQPSQSFQTALTISGGNNKEELIQNIIYGKKKAIKFLRQVNRNIKSKQRNTPEETLQKLNYLRAKDCRK
ncbi:MAG: hypothetical protein KGD63_11030 [Candidatus Lokiarchaeota archaeon]|nr:hypothetical protein [Candidatus Lokiarchaeota archaeon]